MKTTNKKIVAAVALALGMVSASSSALELGEIKVRSAIGERLVAELPLGGDEILDRDCFDVKSDTLTGQRNLLNVTYNGSTLLIKTTRAVLDPIISITITAQCNGTATLRRDYTLFLNPSNRVSEQQRAAIFFPMRQRSAQINRPASSRAVAQVRRSKPRLGAAIEGNRYLVKSGDSVSAIALRRGVNQRDLWPAIEQIVEANPDAFIDNNPDRLLAGATLVLPVAMGAVAAVSKPPETSPEPTFTPPSDNTPPPTSAASQVSELLAQNAEADRLLALIASRELELKEALAADSDTSTEALSDSPFVEPSVVQAAQTQLIAITAAETNSDKFSFWAKIVAAVVGIGALLTIFFMWQMQASARRRRQRAANARYAPVPNSTTSRDADDTTVRTNRLSSLPARARQTTEANYEVSTLAMPSNSSHEANVEYDIDVTDSLPFLLDDAPAEGKLPFLLDETNNVTGLAAEATDSAEDEGSGETTIDEKALDMLERDYEFEMTRTQRLHKDVADAALERAVSAMGGTPSLAAEAVDLESTLEYPVQSGDDTTQSMPTEEVLRAAEQDADIVNAFTDTMAEEGATLKMPSDLDLDFDLTSTLQMDVDDIASDEEAEKTAVLNQAGKKSA